MSKRFLSLIMVAGILLGLSVSGMAQTCNGRRNVNERQRGQRQRITSGVRSGELTAWEASRLGREQRSIRAEERLYRSDGTFTVAERREIRDELSDSNRHIYRTKHNRRDRN